MNIKKGMGIRSKILLGIFTILVILLVISILAVVNIQQVNKRVNDIETKQNELLNYENMGFNMVRANAAIRGYLLFNEAKMIKNYEDITTQLENSIEKIKKTGNVPPNLLEFEQGFTDWTNAIEKQVIPLWQKGEKQRALEIAKPLVGDQSTKLVLLSQDLAKQKEKEIQHHLQSIVSNGTKTEKSMLWISLIAIIVGAAIGIFIGERISKPILQVVDTMDQLAKGDFTKRIPFTKKTSKDELGQLALSTNQMVEQLSTILKKVEETSVQLAASSEELYASSEQTSKATEQITNSIQEITSGTEDIVIQTQQTDRTVTEISNSMEQIGLYTKTTANAAIEASKTAENGNQVMEKAIQQMEFIHTKVGDFAEVVHRLDNKSNQIGQIVQMITEIAEQTNLLALNAAIEAARAGEHGKGFAIVADEVRKLAEQSGNAAQNVNELILDIQNEITEVVHEMKQQENSVSEGMIMIEQAKTSFFDIQRAVDQVSNQMQEVSASVQQVTSGINGMVGLIKGINETIEGAAKNMETIAASTEEQTASMEEIAASSEELAKMAEELKSVISIFKL
ncbi:methyl-accepting chemotaxis protein [Tepidibacillus sp. LV47]|uniref:methyl-accepting chemotaxis protein n=1 Tax=Tepidibacillus sp. LV47 TaxID=3398228 RepID=UPI003AAEDAB7